MNTFFSLSISLVVFLFFSVVAAHCGDGVCDSTVVARRYDGVHDSIVAGCGDCGVTTAMVHAAVLSRLAGTEHTTVSLQLMAIASSGMAGTRRTVSSRLAAITG